MRRRDAREAESAIATRLAICYYAMSRIRGRHYVTTPLYRHAIDTLKMPRACRYVAAADIAISRDTPPRYRCRLLLRCHTLLRAIRH